VVIDNGGPDAALTSELFEEYGINVQAVIVITDCENFERGEPK